MYDSEEEEEGGVEPVAPHDEVDYYDDDDGGEGISPEEAAYRAELKERFSQFADQLACHHAVGFVRLGDGMSPSTALDNHKHHVIAGFSSRTETHYNYHSSKWRKAQEEDAGLTAAAHETGSSREKRYKIKGKVSALASSTTCPSSIRPLLLRRGNFYGTQFYLKVFSMQAAEEEEGGGGSGGVGGDEGDDGDQDRNRGMALTIAGRARSMPPATAGTAPVARAGDFKRMFSGAYLAPLPHLYFVHAEVADVQRQDHRGNEESITVIKDLLSRRVDIKRLATMDGICAVLAYVMCTSANKAHEILAGGNFAIPPIPHQLRWEEVDYDVHPDLVFQIGRSDAIMQTEYAYLLHQAICKALAQYDYAKTAGAANEKYQKRCAELHFGPLAYDQSKRFAEFDSQEDYERECKRMPPTQLAIFSRHPECLYLFGSYYMERLGGCTPDGPGPMFSLDFLYGLSLTNLRELFWYVTDHDLARPVFWGSDPEFKDMPMTPAQRLFFHSQLGPRGSEPERDPSHRAFYDLRMVSLPHPYSRRRAVIGMEELWAEYLFGIDCKLCESANMSAFEFGLCVIIYGLLKQSHYDDKNTCLPKAHIKARLLDFLKFDLTHQQRSEVVEHSSRFRITGYKNDKRAKAMGERASKWLRQALQLESGETFIYPSRQTLHQRMMSALPDCLNRLIDTRELGVLIRELVPGQPDHVYYLIQPYMYERIIVRGTQKICHQFQAKITTAPERFQRAIRINPLVEAAVLRQWARPVLQGISNVVVDHCNRMKDELMLASQNCPDGNKDLLDDIYMPEIMPQFEYAQCPPEWSSECKWYYETYDPRSLSELMNMRFFGPPGSKVPADYHPICSEQLLAFESVGRYPKMNLTGKAGSGKSDLMTLIAAGVANQRKPNNIFLLTFMSAHASTLQQKMASCGIDYPVSTIHSFLDWHSKLCTNHPHMPAELKMKARRMWDYVARENIPFWGSAAQNCKYCPLENLVLYIKDEAGLNYDELEAEFGNVIHNCARNCVGELNAGDVRQLDPVQPGNPFLQYIMSEMCNVLFGHMHRVSKKKMAAMADDILSGTVELAQWNNGECTYCCPCSPKEWSVKSPQSPVRILMQLFNMMKLEYRDTMIACHSNAMCKRLSSELDTFYIGDLAGKKGGNDGRRNFNAMALGPTMKLKYGHWFPNELVLSKKHIPPLNIVTNEILQIYGVVMGKYVRIPYAEMAKARKTLWAMMVDSVLQPSGSMAGMHREVKDAFEMIRERLRVWGETIPKDGERPEPRMCEVGKDDVVIAALTRHYRILLSSYQRENATAQCKEAWQKWLVALGVYKDQPQKVLAVQRCRQELGGDWPPDGHSSMHWHPSSYAHRERRELSPLLSDAQCTNSTDGLTGEWVALLQGASVLMDELRDVARVPRRKDPIKPRDVSETDVDCLAEMMQETEIRGDTVDELVYKMMCEVATDLLLGLQHDLGSGPGVTTNPTPHINPMVRPRPDPRTMPGRRGAVPPPLSETESYRPLDAPFAPHSAWWTCDATSAEEAAFIESCEPNGRAVLMAVAEHEQAMRDKVADIIASSDTHERSNLVLPESLIKYNDPTLPPVDENDFVAFKPMWRAAHSRVKHAEEGDVISFLKCVVRSSWGKVTQQSVVFIPCNETMDRFLRPGSAATCHACQSKQAKNMIMVAPYPLDEASLYTTFTRAETAFYSIAGPGVIDESIKRASPVAISFMHQKLARLKGRAYQSQTNSEAMQAAIKKARELQHLHSLDENQDIRACFSRQHELTAPDAPRTFSLGPRRDAWIRTLNSYHITD